MDGLIRGLVPDQSSDSTAADAPAVEGCTPPLFRLRSPIDAERIAAIRKHERAVLLFESGISAGAVAATLDALAPHTLCAAIVTGVEEIAEFQELIDGDRLFYLSRGELPERDLAALAGAAFPAKADLSPDRVIGVDILRRLALAQSVTAVTDALRSAAESAVHAERTRCLLFDRERQLLWLPDEPEEGESAAVGLVSFIVRTGATLSLPRIGDDPRFDAALDGDASDRFLGVPVRAGRGDVIAVLVASRPAHEPPFEPLDIAAMEALAAHASPYLAAWLVEPEAEGPFRPRALRELDLPTTAGPEPLRLEPRWLRRASWFAIATFLAALLAVILGWGMRNG